MSATRSPIDTYRRQETTLILVSLCVLAAVFLLHVCFSRLLGAPTRPLILVLGVLFLSHIAKLLWLYGQDITLEPRKVLLIDVAGVLWVLLGAFLAALVGEGEEHHYYVLMLPALVAAAFRFPLPGALGFAALANALVLVDVWQYERRHPPRQVTEFFEAAVVCIIFAVVTVVVWALADARRRESDRLALSLAELEDTRDRLIAEAKLAAVGRLASAIAHEIRNPVAMISSALRTVDDETVTADTRAQLYAVAREEMDRLARLTGDFLAYARQRPLECASWEVDAVLAYARDVSQGAATARGVELRIVPRAPIDLYGDREQIQQILLNLVRNAIEASPHGCAVVLQARATADGVDIDVANAGPAITEDVVARLFEPFFTTKAQGTGLGLGLARRLAEGHGGTVALTANDNGRIVFTLTLPARKGDATP